MDRACEPLAPTASVADTVKLLVVGTETELGGPLIALPARFMPAGTLPDVMCQVIGNVPPVALKLREHDVPAVQSASDDVETDGTGLMTSETTTELAPPWVSAACTATLKVPD